VISYITEKSSEIDLDLLMAFFNSQILDWYFRLSSTNAVISEYQINILPIPKILEQTLVLGWENSLKKANWLELTELLIITCKEPGIMPKPVAEALSAMCRRIQEIESQRILKSRSERSRLAPESQPIQDAIDAVLFRCYGLTDDEAQYIDRRLKEML